MDITQRENNRAVWGRHMRSWEESKLSQRAYCVRHALKYQAFLYWRRRLKRTEAVRPLTVVQLNEKVNMHSVIKAHNDIPPSPIRFWVGGFRVEVADHFNADSLARLVHILRGL